MIEREKIIEIFKASPTPTSIVLPDDPKFTFLQVNEAYTKMTQTNDQKIIGNSLFEVFPENPEEEKPTGVERLRNSFRKVISEKSEDQMQVVRYDIRLDDGEYKEIYWKVTNTPVVDDNGKVEFIINSATNITNQVLSERLNKLMLNNTEDSFILINKDLIIQSFNDLFAQNYKDIFGIEVQKGDSIIDYAQPERKEAARNVYEQVFKGETIENEFPIKTQEGNTRFFFIKYKPALDEKNEIIGSFVSLLEKTDEHIAKLELQKNEAYFRALVENGNDVIFILSPEAKPTYISPSIQNVLGYSQEESYKMELMDIVHPDDVAIILSELEKCMDKPGEPIEVTPARMKHKDGRYRWFEGTITNMLHDPAVNGIVDNFRDITERVEYQKAITEAKDQYQSLIQTMNGIVWEADAQTFIFNYVSPQTEELLGYTPDDWIGEKGFWENTIHPEDRKEAVEYCHHQTQKGINHSFEYRIKHKNGHYIWIKDIVTVVSVDGIPRSLRGLMIDITQQKELEQKLLQAYEMAKIGAWELNLQKEKLTWSKFVKELHEVEPDFEPDLETAIEFYKEGWSREEIQHAVDKSITEGTSFDLELIITTAKGNERWIRAVGRPEIQNDVCTRIFGSIQDITERKKAQIELQETEEKFRNVVEHSTNMFYQHDVNGVLDYVSPQSKEFLGYSPDDAQRNWQEYITDHPINKEGEKFTQKAIETGEIQEPYELQLITKDNRIIWAEVNEAPLIKDGKVVGIVGSLTDITERKQYEEQLKESLERYDYASKATRDAIYDWDIVKDNLHWGEGFKKLFGHEPGEGKYPIEKYHESVHPADRDDAFNDLKFTLQDTSLHKWSYEYRFQRDDGSYANVIENGYILRDENGKAIRMIGAIRDISESKQVELKNEIQREVALFFKEQDQLNPILDKVLEFLTKYHKFATAEIWLKNAHATHLSLVANYARHKKGEQFYTLSKNQTQFDKGSGLPGLVWQNQKFELWNNIDSKKSFIRNKAAKKAGIKSAFGIPLFYNEEVTGVLLLSSEQVVSESAQSVTLFEGLQEFLGGEIKRKQQEEEFQLLFESAPEILAVASPNGQFVRVNPAFCEILGYTEEELTTQPFSKFIHPDDLNDTTEEFSETITGERHADNFINRYITKSGDTVWISWYSSDVFGEDNFVFSYGRDVTETIELEQLLQLTNRLAKVGSWELEIGDENKQDQVYWSNMAREIFEAQEDYNPKLSDDLEFFKPESREILQEAIQKAIDKGDSYDHELEIVTAEGTPKWVRCIGSAEFVNGTCKRLFGSIQDITEKKNAALQLEEAYKEKENILESIEDGFFTLDKNWTVTYWNRAAERLLQTPKQQILDQNLWDVFDDAIDLPSYTNYHRTMHEKKNVDFEDYYPTLEKWFDISAYPSPDGISVFFKDITERKKAREKLVELNAELEIRAQELAASNAELEQFAYVASHDLQEPLRMVSSFLTQLDKKYSDKLDEKANEYIHFAVDGAQRMRQIILDLLNYSRLNQEKNKREKVDLNKIIKEVCSLERSHIEETGAELNIKKLPTIKANPTPIKQVFKNLLNNALKYQKEGYNPVIEIDVEELDTHWKFMFKDNGIGIASDFQENIFQLFQRLHTRDQYSGTGIGLAIAKKIIERHGGQIWVESEEGEGSTFYFTLEK